MADTVFTDLTKGQWVQISVGENGYFTNRSNNSIRYREAASQPANGDSRGHRLNPGVGVNYAVVQAPQAVWGYATQDGGRVAVTPS